MTEFIKIKWASEKLAKIGLLDVEYPVPVGDFERFVAGDEFQLDFLLYWFQEYSANSPKDWMDCEPAILRLSELLAPSEENRESLIISGDNWKLQIGSVDLTKEIVTIQRGNYLIAAIQNFGDGRLVVSVYRSLDSKSANYFISLALNPAPDGTVCMRPNNWEYALDSSAGMGNMYAADRGESYLSYWEFGLGVCRDGSDVQVWHKQLGIEPISAKHTAIQIGTCYEKAADSEGEEKECSNSRTSNETMSDTVGRQDAFGERPHQWGLRGDPYLWEELEKTLMNLAPANSSDELILLLESEFLRMVGVPISHNEDVFVEKFAHGGMSSGYVSLSFWREKGIPNLIENFENNVFCKGNYRSGI